MVCSPKKLLAVATGLLISSAVGRTFERDLLYSTEIDALLPRANTPQAGWPCLPMKGAEPKGTAKDPAASGGVLPYTAAMVITANEAHGPVEVPSNSTAAVAERAEEDELAAISLQKRVNGILGELHLASSVKVPTDGSAMISWRGARTNPDRMIMSTNDLSGCTVLVISSPFVAFMVHVWERRDDATWLLEPFSAAQQQQDKEFVAQGLSLVDTLILGLQTGANLANNYNGYFPRGSTTVHVIAPGANPDYEDANSLYKGMNPWYTHLEPQGLIYPNQGKILLEQACDKFGIPRTAGQLSTYRRRYSNDVDHALDDRDKLVLAVYKHDDHHFVNMYWDDDKFQTITQLN